MKHSQGLQRSRLPGFSPYFDRMLQEHDRLRSLLFDGDDDTTATMSEWAPAADLREESDRFVVRVDLPGVDPKDIEVELENGVLTIKGERTESSEKEEGGYHRAERFHGAFFRRFMLPETVEESKVEAHSDKGVLEVVVPKSKSAKPRRITVK